MKARLLHVFMAIGVVGAAIGLPETIAHADTSVGSVRGQVRDKATGEPGVGATVVATSTALQGDQTVLVDDAGLYFLTALPPGEYTLTVYYLNGAFTRNNVVVQVGKEAVVNITVDSASGSSKPKGEIVEVEGTVPIVDQGSTKTGTTLTSDYTNNVPVARTFGQALTATSGAQNDFYGVSLAGSTSAENVYVIEGINTTDTAFGGLSSNLPNEFVQETEIITGGYNAEYGRATGGIVNVVTKQGSNEIHGSVFGYVSPGSFSPAARTVQKEGGSIDPQITRGYSNDLGAEIGGPIIKDRLWFHVGFNPSRLQNVTTRLIQQQIDEHGPDGTGPPDGIPDVDPNTGITKHQRVTSQDIPDVQTTYFFTAKINGELAPNHAVQLSLFGNPASGDRPVDDDNGPFSPGSSLFDRSSGAYDAAAKYTGKFSNGQTQIDALIGFHGAYNNETPHTSIGNLPSVQYGYTRSLYDFRDIEAAGLDSQRTQDFEKCNDGGPEDMYPGIQNCPVDQYTEQGLPVLEKRTNNRLSAILAATQRVKVLGYHVLKAGIDVESSTYDSTTYYTGGAAYLRSCNRDPASPDDDAANCDDANALPGTWQISKYAAIRRALTQDELMNPGGVVLEPGDQITDCAGGFAICSPIPQRVVSTTNRSIGAYLQDSWQILPNLTLNAGLRFEQQVLNNAEGLQGANDTFGNKIPDVAFTLNNWAPRVGAIFDPTAEGKSKIYAHWGRFYENIPMDINVRAFGAEIIDIQDTNVNHRRPDQAAYNPNCNVNHQANVNVAETIAQCDDSASAALLGGGTEFVAPGITGQYSDELVTGAEYELLANVKVGLVYTHRTLPNVIEDVSADNATNYLIANPGNNYDAEAAKLDQQAAMTDNEGFAAQLRRQANALRFVKTFDKPSRNYDAVTLRLDQRPTRRSLLSASYTYSMERGNYPGLFSTETNQLDPNITSLYDLPDLMANRYGLLGLDRPHNVKLDGFYQFDFKAAGVATLGTSLRAQSGIAHNALARHPVYGPGESYLLPRGAEQRSPMSTQADFHASYGYRFSKATQVEVFLNVFNLFDSQEELTADENYTFDRALPVVGGDAEDLKHVKSLSDGVMQNQTVTKNKNFLNTTKLSTPRNFQFGGRVTF